VRPPSQFGDLKICDGQVQRFVEKADHRDGWVSGGFFVLSSKIFNYVSGDDAMFEGRPLERLAREGQLMAYRHSGFWQCMDTVKDRDKLAELATLPVPPWQESPEPRSTPSGHSVRRLATDTLQ
jgi:glucose-1-phosphate cytidylyltransferase